MEKNIGIIVDSSCDITEEEAKAMGITVMPLPIFINGKEYYGKMSYEELVEHLRNDERVTTSQISLGLLLDVFERASREYEEVVYIPISSGLSGMCNTVSSICAQFDNIYVIDSRTISLPTITLCKEIQRLWSQGKKAKEIKSIMEANELVGIIIPDDIRFLKTGGRLAPAALAIANVLKIVPVLIYKDGKIDLYEKVKTKKKAFDKGLDMLTDVKDPADYYWGVEYATVDMKKVEELTEKVKKLTKQNVELCELGHVIVSHTGPDTLVVSRLKKFDV